MEEVVESSPSSRQPRTSEPSIVGLLDQERASSRARSESVPLLEDVEEKETTLTNNSAAPRSAVLSTDPVLPAALNAASALPSRLNAAEDVKM
jgi:hypothetical protein